MFLTRDKPQQGRFFTGGYGTAGTTTTTSLASQGGLLINIDSATGDIARTTDGWIEDEKYGFYFDSFTTTVSGEFDTAVTRTGTKTLKLSNTNATGTCVATTGDSRAVTYAGTTNKLIPLKPSTKYRASVWVKTNNVVSNSANFRVWYWNSSFAGRTDTLVANSISGTNDWQRLVINFTTSASAAYGMIELTNQLAGNISDAWFDINSMTLEEVIEPVANSLVTPSPSLVSFTAVGSTDNIDQSFTTTPDGSIAVGDVGGLDYMDSQSFTPTKSKHTGVYLYKRANSGTPTGNLKIDVRTDNGSGDPTSTILATTTIPLATYNALSTNAEFLVNLPCNVTPGTKHHYVTTNTANESVGNGFNLGCLVAGGYTGGDARFSTDGGTVWIINGSRDFYFKSLYYKPTTNFKASQNNLSVSVSADEDGFLDGAVTNILTGAYTWGLGASATDLITGASVYSATVGSGNAAGSQTIINNYGFFNFNSYNWIGTNTTTNTQDLIWKFTTTRPILGDVIVTFRTFERPAGTTTMAYSLDNASYTTMGTIANSANIEANYSYTITGLVGETDFFIRFRRAGASSKQDIANLAVSTTVNTTSINGVLKNYPTNKDIIKQYATTLSGATTSATYRATKWGFPAIEYSATEYQFLDVDTTATGSTVAFSELGTTYTTVADGASLAISSTSTPNIFVKANITANRIYSSSNDYSASSDKDGSLRQNVVYQVVQ